MEVGTNAGAKAKRGRALIRPASQGREESERADGKLAILRANSIDRRGEIMRRYLDVYAFPGAYYRGQGRAVCRLHTRLRRRTCIRA